MIVTCKGVGTECKECRTKFPENNCYSYEVYMKARNDAIDELPAITKSDIFEDVKREIKVMKTKVCSTNTDYNTGYISALSTLEGFLAEKEQAFVKEYDTKEYADSHPEWVEKIKRLAKMEEVE